MKEYYSAKLNKGICKSLKTERIQDFNDFMVIINRAKEIHGNHFTYTLLISSDING